MRVWTFLHLDGGSVHISLRSKPLDINPCSSWGSPTVRIKMCFSQSWCTECLLKLQNKTDREDLHFSVAWVLRHNTIICCCVNESSIAITHCLISCKIWLPRKKVSLCVGIVITAMMYRYTSSASFQSLMTAGWYMMSIALLFCCRWNAAWGTSKYYSFLFVSLSYGPNFQVTGLHGNL